MVESMNIEEAQLAASARALALSGAARAIRLAAHLSLSEMAGLVEVAPSTLSRYERQQRSPRTEHAVRYGRVLGELAAR
jgi:transcriptional regulator with XRE-family HTH domain